MSTYIHTYMHIMCVNIYINIWNSAAEICGGGQYMIKEAFQISGDRLSLPFNGIGTTDKAFGKKLFLCLTVFRT